MRTEEAVKALIEAKREEFLKAPLWRAVEMALEDMKSFLATNPRKHKIDMAIFVFDNVATGCCYVCLAGAAMFQRLDMDYLGAAGPEMTEKLGRISDVALGSWVHGNYSRKLDEKTVERMVGLHKPYCEDPKAWEAYIHESIEVLKAHNI